ncbi:MAG: 2-C-methyl-D-erythritol 2,4-cyclodiphosphate synthase [Pyrinomonadaceae bacterium]
MRIGFGTDIHRLEQGRELRLGGIAIDAPFGSLGHSDGDALLHAITDAILGAVAAGDIGTHFPPSDERWKDANSKFFLTEAVSVAKNAGFRIGNIDSVVHLEKPKLRPHIDSMRESIASICGIETTAVSVKAKTAEGLGDIGSSMAVSADAIVLLVAVE